MPMHEGVETALRKIPLENYQVKCLDFVLKHKKCGLFLDIGYGKTLTTLAAIGMLGCRNVLIVAPKAIARTTWHAEVRKWSLPFECYSMVEKLNPKTGKKTMIPQKDLLPLYQAMQQMPGDKTHMFITTRDRVTHLADWCIGTGIWPFDMIVCDEFQSFKGGKTNRTKAITELSAHTQRLVGLTGTPMPNSLEDVWSEVKILDNGARLGRYITQFRNEYMHSTMIVNGHAVGWKPNPGAMDRVFSKIADIVISVHADLGLPPLNIQDFPVDLPAGAMAKYNNFLKQGTFDLRDLDPFAEFRTPDGNAEISPQNAAVLAAKLLQMASGTLYDSGHNTYVLHDVKLEALQYIVDNTGGPVLVAYHFQCDEKRILENIKLQPGEQAVKFDGSEEMKDAWNRGEYRLMLLQPASTCHGINLQDGGSTLVWYSIPWSLEHYDQTIGRLHRKGQTKPVMVIRIIANNTLDASVAAALKKKGYGNDALLTAVRREFTKPIA